MNYEALIISISVIAMMCPSVYTIAWSKQEKSRHLPVLYIGLGISALTIIGALITCEELAWLGLIGAFAFFLYIIFFYKET